MGETRNNHTQHFSGKEIGLKLLVDCVQWTSSESTGLQQMNIKAKRVCTKAQKHSAPCRWSSQLLGHQEASDPFRNKYVCANKHTWRSSKCFGKIFNCHLNLGLPKSPKSFRIYQAFPAALTSKSIKLIYKIG